MIHERYYTLKEEQEKLITRKMKLTLLGTMVFMIDINIQ